MLINALILIALICSDVQSVESMKVWKFKLKQKQISITPNFNYALMCIFRGCMVTL